MTVVVCCSKMKLAPITKCKTVFFNISGTSWNIAMCFRPCIETLNPNKASNEIPIATTMFLRSSNTINNVQCNFVGGWYWSAFVTEFFCCRRSHIGIFDWLHNHWSPVATVIHSCQLDSWWSSLVEAVIGHLMLISPACPTWFLIADHTSAVNCLKLLLSLVIGLCCHRLLMS